MNREVILTRLPVGDRRPLAWVLYENGRPVQLELEPAGGEERTGNIYVGKIEKLVPSMQAAFVRFASGQSGYLPLAKAKRPLTRIPLPDGRLREQDELLVQVEREGSKGKLPSLTASLEFSGSLLVLLTDSNGIRFSPRLTREQKKRAEAQIRELQKGRERSFGVLVRTNGGKASPEELSREFEALYREAYQICQYGCSRSVYSCLRRTDSFWARQMAGIPRKEPVRVITDEPELYEKIKAFLSQSQDEEVCRDKRRSEDSGVVSYGGWLRLEKYQETLQPLFKKYALDELLSSLLDRRVLLPSGGFLVIEQTEAFVAVDVNSGKRKGERTPEEFYFRVNLEAAEEIPRQLRLRSLSGTVLIDFINMRDKEQTGRLMSELQRGFREDPVRTQVIDVTRLNITEVTRQKVRKPLWEQVEQYRCGAGSVDSGWVGE